MKFYISDGKPEHNLVLDRLVIDDALSAYVSYWDARGTKVKGHAIVSEKGFPDNNGHFVVDTDNLHELPSAE